MQTGVTVDPEALQDMLIGALRVRRCPQPWGIIRNGSNDPSENVDGLFGLWFLIGTRQISTEANSKQTKFEGLIVSHSSGIPMMSRGPHEWCLWRWVIPTIPDHNYHICAFMLNHDLVLPCFTICHNNILTIIAIYG